MECTTPITHQIIDTLMSSWHCLVISVSCYSPQMTHMDRSHSVTDWFPLSSRKPTGYSLNVLPKLIYWQNAWIDAAAPTNAGMQVTLNVACTRSQQNTKVSGVLWP